MESQAALVLSVSETMAILMRSMGYYVFRRIDSKEGREAYRLAILECIGHVSAQHIDLGRIKSEIIHTMSKASAQYQSKLFNNREKEKQCHIMAAEQAMEIVESIEARFITGQADRTPRIYKFGGHVYEDKESFGF